MKVTPGGRIPGGGDVLATPAGQGSGAWGSEWQASEINGAQVCISEKSPWLLCELEKAA